MRRAILRRAIAALGPGLLLAPAAVLAHAIVEPAVAPPGAYQRYVLRVPTERDVATARIEILFPEQVTVVSFSEVAGWTLDVRTDASGRVTGAVWTGTLPPERFVELPFVAVNPRDETTVSWRVRQTYAGGEVVEWFGPEDSGTPASVTRIEDPGAGADWISWAALGAIALAVVALGLALRPRKPSSTHFP